MEQLTNYIQPELLVLIPVMYLIGMGLKKTKKVSDNLIPLAVGIISVILASVFILSTHELEGYRDVADAIFSAVTQGILCGGTSVYFNQLIKQTMQKTELDETEE